MSSSGSSPAWYSSARWTAHNERPARIEGPSSLSRRTRTSFPAKRPDRSVRGLFGSVPAAVGSERSNLATLCDSQGSSGHSHPRPDRWSWPWPRRRRRKDTRPGTLALNQRQSGARRYVDLMVPRRDLRIVVDIVASHGRLPRGSSHHLSEEPRRMLLTLVFVSIDTTLICAARTRSTGTLCGRWTPTRSRRSIRAP